MYIGDKLPVYDKAFADSHKSVVVGVKHFGDSFFHLAQLLGKDIFSAVGHLDGGVVAVCRYVDDRLCRHSDKFCGCGE